MSPIDGRCGLSPGDGRRDVSAEVGACMALRGIDGVLPYLSVSAEAAACIRRIMLLFFACHAFCGTACKKPAKLLDGRIFNPALPFADARSDWADISRAVGALLRMSALRTLMVVLFQNTF